MSDEVTVKNVKPIVIEQEVSGNLNAITEEPVPVSIMTEMQTAEDETTASAADLTATEEYLAAEIKKEPNKLPEPYLTEYKNAQTEEEQRKIIEKYFADKTYFPDKPKISETASLFGNRASKKATGGISMRSALSETVLLDENYKPDKDACEERYDTLRSEYEKNIEDTLSNTKISDDKKAQAWFENAVKSINADTTLTAEPKAKKIAQYENDALKMAQDSKLINECLDGAWSSKVDELAKEIDQRSAIDNITDYCKYVLDNDEQGELPTNSTSLYSEMTKLLNKEELTDEDKQQLDLYVKQYNNRFSDNQFPENYNLSYYKKFLASDKKEVQDKLVKLANILAMEEKMGFDTKQEAAPKITAEQLTQLARAKASEAITGDVKRKDLETAAYNLRTEADKLSAAGDKKGAKKLEKLAKKCDKDVKEIQKNKEKNLDNIKKAMVHEQPQYQVEFEVYKQKYDATTVHWDKKTAKKSENNGNNTYLNDYARDLILNDSEFRGYTCDESDESNGDFKTADGKWYKLNSDKYKNHMQYLSNRQINGIDHEYDTSYYVNANEWSKFANTHAKKRQGVATMGERSDVREMFEAAGLQVEGDHTYGKRAKKMGNDALAAVGTSALASIGTEVFNMAGSVGVNSKVTGMVSAVIQGTVGTTVTGTVSGTEYVDLTSQVIDNGVLVSSQTTTVPVNWSGSYSRYVELPYEDQVDLSYTNEFHCKVKNKFDWGNVALGTGIGTAVSAAVNGWHYLFGKKTEDDYDNTTHNSGRENTGYENKTAKEPEPVTEDKSVEVTIETEEETEETIVEEKPIETTEYRLKKRRDRDGKIERQTLSNMICAKYGVTYNSPEYKAILKYVRDINGCKNREIPKGDVWTLPNEIPAEVCGDGNIKLLDKEVGYTKDTSGTSNVKAGGNKSVPTKKTTTTKTSTTTNSQTDVWDKQGNNDAVKRKLDEN